MKIEDLRLFKKEPKLKRLAKGVHWLFTAV